MNSNGKTISSCSFHSNRSFSSTPLPLISINARKEVKVRGKYKKTTEIEASDRLIGILFRLGLQHCRTEVTGAV
jgi:hypothetical protein